MVRKAKLKYTGEIIDVHVDMDYHGNTTWVDAKTNTEYSPSELEFIPDAKEQQSLSLRILSQFSDEELREELKRRADDRKALKGEVMRCRDCRHCIQGYTTRRAASRGYKTSVCELRPKDKEWRGCFYSTLHSRKACDMFEKK